MDIDEMTEIRHSLPLRTAADTSGVVHDLLSKFEERGTNIAVARLAANSSAGFRPFVLMTDGLSRRSVLDPKVREIVILHLAARHGCEYEWARHEVGARRCGVTDDQIAVLRSLEPVTSPAFAESELLACALADDLIDGVDITQEWDTVADLLGHEEAVDLLFVVAFWGGFVPVLFRGLLPLSATEIGSE